MTVSLASRPSTITPHQREKIRRQLRASYIPVGVGNADNACSVASINLALTGRLTDWIPECMSPVIGKWIIHIQDAMPDDLRNSTAWKKLLPYAAGTGREKAAEERRSVVIDSWLWDSVFPLLLGLPEIARSVSQTASLESSLAAHSLESYLYDNLWYVDDYATGSYSAQGAFSEVVDALGATNEDSEKFWSAVNPVGTLEALILA